VKVVTAKTAVVVVAEMMTTMRRVLMEPITMKTKLKREVMVKRKWETWMSQEKGIPMCGR
jgi:hypothetical protein